MPPKYPLKAMSSEYTAHDSKLTTTVLLIVLLSTITRFMGPGYEQYVLVLACSH